MPIHFAVLGVWLHTYLSSQIPPVYPWAVVLISLGGVNQPTPTPQYAQCFMAQEADHEQLGPQSMLTNRSHKVLKSKPNSTPVGAGHELQRENKKNPFATIEVLLYTSVSDPIIGIPSHSLFKIRDVHKQERVMTVWAYGAYYKRDVYKRQVLLYTSVSDPIIGIPSHSLFKIRDVHKQERVMTVWAYGAYYKGWLSYLLAVLAHMDPYQYWVVEVDWQSLLTAYQ
ncbi:hypothetical protein G9A89_000351 [Geosiphon pyriformis]|nr:hypothetical protein G9A89_000351 [Geosiphon pyriformis]